MREEQSQLRQWAIRGAEQRLLDITKEMEAIHRVFPELRRRRDGFADGNGLAPTPANRGGRRGRRRMSADARRRISEAQKARWAKQRGEKTAATATPAKPARAAKAARRGGARKMSAAARRRISEAMKGPVGEGQGP